MTSIQSMVRGAMYVGTIAAPGIVRYQTKIAAGQDPMTAVGNTMKNYTGVKDDGTWTTENFLAMNTPIIVWSVMDFTASKLGVWRRIGAATKGLMKM